MGPGVLDSLSRAPGTSWAAAVALLAIAGTPVAGPLDLTGNPPRPGSGPRRCSTPLIGLFVLLPTVTTIARGRADGRFPRWPGRVASG